MEPHKRRNPDIQSLYEHNGEVLEVSFLNNLSLIKKKNPTERESGVYFLWISLAAVKSESGDTK